MLYELYLAVNKMENQGYCQCGCGTEIVYKKHHKNRNIKFIHGHNHKGRNYNQIYGDNADLQRKKRKEGLAGKTYEEIYGNDKAIELRKKISESHKKNNSHNKEIGIRTNSSITQFKKGIIPHNKGKSKFQQKRILCGCGCGTEINYLDCSGRPRNCINGHQHRMESWKNKQRTKQIREGICACGCGEKFYTKKDKQKFINLHNSKSDSFKELIRKALIGRVSPHKGKHVRTNTGRTHFKKGHTAWNKDKKMSVELRKKYSEAGKKSYQNGRKTWHAGKHGVYSKERMEQLKKERAVRILPRFDTKIEIKLQNYLQELGIEHYTHFFINDIINKYQSDIFIPIQNNFNKKIIVEADGDYFHGNPLFYTEDKLNETQKKQMERDRLRNQQLNEKGYKVLRIWENEINKMTIDKFKEKLNEI